MKEFNLLQNLPRVTRDIGARLVNKEENRKKAMQFGSDYFDGDRQTGYGGYYYDGRWIKIAKRAIKRYGLTSGMRVLDIGCAKGFFVYDLETTCSGLQAVGVDISAYAIENCHPQVKQNLQIADAATLPFADACFDAVFAINSLHNLDKTDCIRAIGEINRVVKNPSNCFIQVDSFRNNQERQLFEDWMLTAKTYCRPDEWKSLFETANYKGDYFWTIMEFSDLENPKNVTNQKA